jgi:IS30 family transposase
MGHSQRQQEVRSYRGQIPSPGRPTVAWREDRVRFWAAIASGVKTEDACVEARVSGPVGFRWFRHAGGVNPRLPAEVSGRYLSFSEREDIAIWHAQKVSAREIARRLGRLPSTISRELRRNASTRTYYLDYKAMIAQWHAERRARRPKTAKLVANHRLRAYVQDRLAGVVHLPDGTIAGPAGPVWKGRNKPHRGDRRWVTSWSPEQIANRLEVDFPDDESMRISHEAICQALYVEGRGALKRELVACLRTGRALRVPRARNRQQAWGHVTKDVLISERPAEAEDRAIPGHWEGDLIIGLQRSAIGTLVERTTRFTMLIHLPREEGYGTIPRQERASARGLWRDHHEEPARRDHDHLARATAPVADLGPRQGALGPRAVQGRDRDPGVLRRSPQPLATREQRERQRPTAPVLRQGHRPFSLE